jgi:hypothetical protein
MRTILLAVLFAAGTNSQAATQEIAVGPQYDTTHVYVAPKDFDRFVTSLVATFGGTTSLYWHTAPPSYPGQMRSPAAFSSFPAARF